jgi:hypothetical protein
MRDGSKTVLERAFELARSGTIVDVEEIRKTLSREGYDLAQLAGSTTLTRQLRKTLKETKITNLDRSRS